jgi:hypothetical protein
VYKLGKGSKQPRGKTKSKFSQGYPQRWKSGQALGQAEGDELSGYLCGFPISRHISQNFFQHMIGCDAFRLCFEVDDQPVS